MWWDGLAGDRMFLYCSTLPARWKSDRPMSRQQFEALFPDDAACARYLVGRRWPDGFACPVCGVCKGWASNHDRPARECAGCRRQSSVTAGTGMHGSHLPLCTRFIAAHIVAGRSDGIPDLQSQARVGIGSTKAARLLLHTLRRAMVDPDRSLLQQIVEVDETGMPFRRKADPTRRPAERAAERLAERPTERPAEEPDSSRKIRVVGAVELAQDRHPGRIRLERIFDRSSKTLHGLNARMVEPGAHVITDGLISRKNMPDNTHEPRVVSDRNAHEILHRVHLGLLEPQAMGQGRCRANPSTGRMCDPSRSTAFARSTSNAIPASSALRAFSAFIRSPGSNDRCATGSEVRWNRRRRLRTAFDRLIGIGVGLAPASCRDIVEHRA